MAERTEDRQVLDDERMLDRRKELQLVKDLVAIQRLAIRCSPSASGTRAEGAGFEPAARVRRAPVFKTGALNRSATPPSGTVALHRADAAGRHL